SSSSAIEFPFRGQRPVQDMLPFANLRAKSLSYWMLAQTQHAVESDPRMAASVLVNGDTVNDVALTQILERPEKMLRSDTEHRGADADAGIERDDFVVLQFLAEAIDQVNFCAHGPLRADRRGLDGFDDTLGRADLIGGLGDLEAAFGMRDDANSAMLASKGFDGRDRVHVRDGDDLRRIDERREFAPAGFHLADVGHIGHRAAGVQVGQDNDLVLTAKNISAFGHEMDTAENDVAAFGFSGL